MVLRVERPVQEESLRRRRAASGRRAQYRRADGRAAEHLLAAFAAIGARRGQRLSGLAQALRTALQGAHPPAGAAGEPGDERGGGGVQPEPGGLQDPVDDLGAALADWRTLAAAAMMMRALMAEVALAAVSAVVLAVHGRKGAASERTAEARRSLAAALAELAAIEAETALDKAFVGRVSSLQLAALGPASAAIDCSSYVLTFLNTATLSMLGSGPASDHNKIRSHALAFTVVLGALQGLLLFVAASRVVRLLGAAGGMLPLSALYLQIRAVGASVDRLGSVSTQFFLARKDGVTPMLATLIAAVFNAGGDFVLCPRYGVGGAAVATVAATSVSTVFIVRRLWTRRVWPRPFEAPTLRDFGPFLTFAGPIFCILLMKIALFALMTVYASSLGTAPAAAHQILVSVFFVTGVAFGQPLSWAAQTFMTSPKGHAERRRTWRAFLKVASAFTCLSGAAAFCVTCYCSGFFTQDALVLEAARNGLLSITTFAMLYTLYLAMEGVAIAKKRLNASVIINVALVAAGPLVMGTLHRSGQLTVASLWASQASGLEPAPVSGRAQHREIKLVAERYSAAAGAPVAYSAAPVPLASAAGARAPGPYLVQAPSAPRVVYAAAPGQVPAGSAPYPVATPSSYVTPALSATGPPARPPALTAGMPDPSAIEMQKLAYNKSLEEQALHGEEMLKMQQKQQTEYIFQAAEAQKRQIMQRWRRWGKELQLSQKYCQQVMNLQQEYQHQKLILEKQANDLVLEFQQRKSQEEMMEQQYQMQRSHYEEQVRALGEMQKQAPEAPLPAQYAAPPGPVMVMVQNPSYVPAPVPQGASYVPVPQGASYVPLPQGAAYAPVPQGASYVPPMVVSQMPTQVTAVAPASYVPPPVAGVPMMVAAHPQTTVAAHPQTVVAAQPQQTVVYAAPPTYVEFVPAVPAASYAGGAPAEYAPAEPTMSYATAPAQYAEAARCTRLSVGKGSQSMLSQQ
ncbi:unnamed protein product [Prorocentrum cordatum]|uniref:Protein RFT1 homolog n=1 Tax=Prorocentrum cordatum TaxID=2364126 RepID=A0ABN9TDR1_9DINO|nr:unnamed protein product [Polarella glacialis]